MTFNPKVSIVIPVYNGSNYLRDAIKSALAQTYKNIEVIVINDGSTDNGATEKIAKSFGNKIRYFKKDNGGVATALNLGIEKMTGDYFSWLSHDDKYKPDKVKKQIEYLRTNKDKDVILYSDYDLINSKGDFITRVVLDHEMLERVPIYSLLRGSINGITLLIPKSAFDEYGEFDPSLRTTQDYDMWHRMMRTYKFIHLGIVQTMTRIHPEQDTVAHPAAITEGNVLWKRIIKDLPDSEKIKAEGSLLVFYLEMVKFLNKNTKYTGALEYCEKKLENITQTKEAGLEGSKSIKKAINTFEKLISNQQTRAAAYYLDNVIKQIISTGNNKSAVFIFNEKLIGENVGLSKKDIEKNYISKIGNKSNKPRLMFCSGQWLTGGMERVLSILFYQLKDEYELYLLAPFDGRIGKIDLPKYVTQIKISNDNFYNNSYDYIALTYAFLFDIDIAVGFLHLWGRQLDFYNLCVGTRVKTIASNHEIYFYPYRDPSYYGYIQKRIDIFNKLDAVLWLTNFSAASYGLVGNNSYLMPNPNTYKVQTNIASNKEKIIICVGRFNDYVKRIDRILNCFSLVLKTQPEAKLMLVGECNRNVPIKPNEDTTINDLIEKLNIDERKILFIGEVNNVEKYYAQASLLLLASNNEGFGMVINEAACFGVPSVCNRIPGLEDLVVDGENGFLIEQDDIESMAVAVKKILSNEELRDRLGANAKKNVTRFDSTEVGNRWKYLINTLLEDNTSESKTEKLNKRLNYKITDYKNFSRLLFDEMSSIVSINNDYNLKFDIPTVKTSKNKRRVKRLKGAIKTKGYLQTSWILSKMVFRKIKSIV